MHLTLEERCQRIEVLVLDVDGVLTDGRIVYTDDGTEVKAFHVRDGVALKAWREAGKWAAIISGRKSRAVERRAAELGINMVFQGVPDKRAAYREVLGRGPWQSEQACCVGDDLPDWPLLTDCGLAITVADACPEVRAVAHYVTGAAGGQGAVRETIELILRGQQRWLPPAP